MSGCFHTMLGRGVAWCAHTFFQHSLRFIGRAPLGPSFYTMRHEAGGNLGLHVAATMLPQVNIESDESALHTKIDTTNA